MKKLITAIITFIVFCSIMVVANNTVLDYNKLIILDAEDLAEAGIKGAYENIKPILKNYVTNPSEIIEKQDNNLPKYSVICSGVTYDIYSPTLPDSNGESWARATHAFFAIINNQLKGLSVKFYAINGGNDLGGMLLNDQQVAAAKKSLKKKADWPYIPALEPPWYGQYH